MPFNSDFIVWIIVHLCVAMLGKPWANLLKYIQHSVSVFIWAKGCNLIIFLTFSTFSRKLIFQQLHKKTFLVGVHACKVMIYWTKVS